MSWRAGDQETFTITPQRRSTTAAPELSHGWRSRSSSPRSSPSSVPGARPFLPSARRRRDVLIVTNRRSLGGTLIASRGSVLPGCPRLDGATYCRDLVIDLVHGVGGEHQDLRPGSLQLGRLGGEELPARSQAPAVCSRSVWAKSKERFSGPAECTPPSRARTSWLMVCSYTIKDFPAHTAQQPESSL
jgi:hypothetical protein